MVPATSEGRLPGCEEDRLLPVGRPRENVPGNEEDVTLVPEAEPADAVESAGEDERDVGGADDFVVLRWKIVPWLVVWLIIGWLANSERVVS